MTVLAGVLVLDGFGFVSLIRNGIVKVSVQGKSLSDWVGGLLFGSAFGTVFLGVPFFLGAYFAPREKETFIALGVATGVCLPLWLDALLTLRHLKGRRSYQSGRTGGTSDRFLQVIGLLLCLTAIVMTALWITFR